MPGYGSRSRSPPSALNPLFEPLHLHSLSGVPEAHIETAEIAYVLVGDPAALALTATSPCLALRRSCPPTRSNSSTDSPASSVPNALRSFPSQRSRSCLCCISMNPSQLMHSIIGYSPECMEGKFYELPHNGVPGSST